MNHDEYRKILPAIEEIRKEGVKLLVIIVNRRDGGKVIKFLREHHLALQYSCMAEGTQGSELLDLLGLGTIDKTIVFAVAPCFRVKAALQEAVTGLRLKKAGQGIAFTIPLVGACFAGVNSEKLNLFEHVLSHLEDEVDRMNNDIKHSVIMAVVNQGNSEDLVKAAKKAGAKGGTVINARRTGTDEATNFFGMTVQIEKEVVAIVTPREHKHAIMDAINAGFGLKTPAHGIILSIPVDSVAGIEV